MGIFNRAIGTVIEILYEKDMNSNHRDLQACIIVGFSGYVGLETLFLQHVSISNVNKRCEKVCSIRTFVPLQQSFARTIHTKQSMMVYQTITKMHVKKTHQRKKYLDSNHGNNMKKMLWK